MHEYLVLIVSCTKQESQSGTDTGTGQEADKEDEGQDEKSEDR